MKIGHVAVLSCLHLSIRQFSAIGLKHEPQTTMAMAFISSAPVPSLLSCSSSSSSRHPLPLFMSSSSLDSSSRTKKSAFGKAAIGRDKTSPIKTSRNDKVTRRPVGSKGTKKATINIQTAITTKEVTRRRDSALKALRTHLNLTLESSVDVLNRHPRLYTHLPDLSHKLLYLLNEINIKAPQLRNMLLSHPHLMENVFMDSEDNLTNTMEVLQTELDLSIEDIKAIQSKALPAILSYPRSELRKRILVYKLDLGYPTEEIKKMVLKDPRMLRTNSDNVRQILKVLREELDVGKEDVHAMLHKEILLLTYNAEDNIRPTIQFLKTCEFGLCLGMVERKGVSTLSVSTEAEQEEIIQSRLKTIIMGHPKILSSSLEKNLKPTVEFFVRELGLSMHEFGRVIYRRGGSLLEANVERNLRPKVDFLRSELGLELDADFEQEDGENPIGFCVANNNDQPIKVEAPFPELKSQKDGKVATRASTNEMNPTNVEKKRLLAQMLATVPDILTLSIENNLKPKFSYLRGTLGFSRDQVRFIVLKRPQLLALSLANNIIPKIDYFLKERRNITAKTNADTYRGGLGMSKEEIREWIVKYPQTLTFVLESRIRPRVFDAVRLGLGVGDEESQAPMNFVTRSDRSWKSWMDA